LPVSATWDLGWMKATGHGDRMDMFHKTKKGISAKLGVPPFSPPARPDEGC